MMETNTAMEIDSVGQQPINLINQVSEQFLSQGRHVSPMLNAIQELRGTVPGEKYRMINQMVKVKSNNDAEPNDPELDLPAEIQYFVSVKVDIEKKSTDVIIQCLKSEDKTLVTQAFKAKWFFHHTNPVLNVDFFASSVIPHVSEYTRFRIIKALSHCLVPTPSKAEEFFIYFADRCGDKIALPLLTACGEDFIFDEVLRRKLYLPQHMLLTIYNRRPTVAIRYLNLGNNKNKEYEEARKIHTINLSYYKKFIPHLIRHHVEFFIELVESDWCIHYMNIGSTLTSLFFKQATKVFLEKPALFLGLWSIKVVGKRLTRKQYETMYFNLFPKNIKDFRSSLPRMIDYLKGYPLEKRYSLLSSQFKLKYQKDFVESIESIQLQELNAIYDHLSVELYEKLFIKLFPQKKNFRIDSMIDNMSRYPKEKRLDLLLQTYQLKYGENLLDDLEQVRSEKLFEMLPFDLKMSLSTKIIEPFEVKSKEYYDNYYFMPLNECFPVYKEAIQKSSDANDRIRYVEKMLKSCALYSDMEGLLQVIQYYIVRHSNEKVDIFQKFLLCLGDNFNLKSFNEKHWIAILTLLQNLSIRGELTKVRGFALSTFFNTVAYFMYCTEAGIAIDQVNKQSILTMFHSLVLDYNIDRSYVEQVWHFSSTSLSVQKSCIEAFLQCIPVRYPPEHYSWKKNGSWKKSNLVLAMLSAMNNYNDEVKKQDSSNNYQKCDMREYPWLFNTTKELLDSRVSDTWLLKIIKAHSPELYNLFMNETDFAVDIKKGSAWIQLKKDYSTVMEHWPSYLKECREQLRYNSKKGGPAARRFLLSIKWYNSLPMHFVEQCLKELNESGSLKVLAILLENEVFASLATAFAPNESITNYQDAKEYFALVKTIPPAINFVNPPLPFDVIIKYCKGNYTQLAVQAFEHTTHLVSKEKIMAFADNLITRPVSVKKHGIRLLYKVSSDNELRLFVINMLKIEKHASIRELICNVSKERLIKSPTDENWRLVQICISALTIQDEACLNLLCDVKKMKNKFLTEYVAELVKKIEELTKDPEFPQAIKTECISTLLSDFPFPLVKHLSQEVILQLLEKYYFDTDSLEISTVAQSFANLVFSKRYLRGR